MQYPAQYVVINIDTGTVIWCESYLSALDIQPAVGGSILNTASANPQLVQSLLASARANM